MSDELLPIPELEGEIYIVAGKDEEEEIGQVILSGDPAGLRSLGNILIAVADLNQSSIEGLPEDGSEHIHLYAGKHIGNGDLATHHLIISRLDMKNGRLKGYYKSSLPKKRKILEIRRVVKSDNN